MTNPKPGAATDVGARLREAREARDLSLRLVADRTHISVMALEALERNDLRRLPGGIFTRAFLRAYASEVGLDPECTVRDFLAQFPHDAGSAVGLRGQVEDGKDVDNERLIAQTVVRLVALSLPLAGALVYLGMRSPGAASVADLVGQPAAAVRAADAGAVGLRLLDEAAPASAGAAPGGDVAAALTMVVAPVGDCWLSPVVDGEEIPPELLAGGQRRELRAVREIVVTVGDAAACAYTLNGRAGLPFGGPGQIVTRRITLDNYQVYLKE